MWVNHRFIQEYDVLYFAFLVRSNSQAPLILLNATYFQKTIRSESKTFKAKKADIKPVIMYIQFKLLFPFHFLPFSIKSLSFIKFFSITSGNFTLEYPR